MLFLLLALKFTKVTYAEGPSIADLPIEQQMAYLNGGAAYRADDYQKAMELWLPLAESGNGEVQFYVGEMYRFGQGVPRDLDEAYRWLTLAAENGNVGAQSTLGTLLFLGFGRPKDLQESTRYYRLAAEQGDAFAQYALGVALAAGDGVVQDYAEAVKWFGFAAIKGDFSAQDRLGGMYEYGRGVPQDYVRAHMWYNIACSNSANTRLGCLERENLAQYRMSPADVSEAQRMARACLESGYEDCALPTK